MIECSIWEKRFLFYEKAFFNGKSYLVPISEIAGKTAFRWRYEYPSSGQKQRIHLAEDYELEKQISKLKGEVVK